MPDPPDRVPVVSLGGRGPWPARILVAVAVILAIAVAKPWQGPPPAAVASLPPLPTIAPATPVATLPAVVPFDVACFAGRGWTVTTLEGSGRSEVRTWYSLQPSRAAGPLDPAIPVTRVYGLDVRTLGYCVATPPGGLPPIARSTAWQVVGAGAAEVGLVRLAAASPADANRGSSFVPASPPPGAARPRSTANDPAWPSGRFVFRVEYADGTTATAWFAVDIIAVPTMVSGTPSTSAPRSPGP